MFNLLRNHWAVLQNGYTLIATSPSVWGPVPPHLCHCLQLSLILASLAAVKWYLTVVLLCISLMSIEAEHLFTGSFANPISSLESDSSNFLLPLLNCLSLLSKIYFEYICGSVSGFSILFHWFILTSLLKNQLTTCMYMGYVRIFK